MSNILGAYHCGWAFFIQPHVLVDTTVMAKVAAIEAEVAAVVAEVLPVVADLYAIVTDVTIKTGPALGLCGNGEEYTGGEENSQFRFHDLKF